MPHTGGGGGWQLHKTDCLPLAELATTPGRQDSGAGHVPPHKPAASGGPPHGFVWSTHSQVGPAGVLTVLHSCVRDGHAPPQAGPPFLMRPTGQRVVFLIAGTHTLVTWKWLSVRVPNWSMTSFVGGGTFGHFAR